ncbi:hypothetical protein BLSTO_04261 [Blastocystis sp. subtype 1]
MKMTLMEKEEQLRSSASNYEALREQGRAQVGELTRQVAQLRGALAEEKAKREEEQRALEACEKKMEGVIEARVVSAQQKEKESSRQMQRGFEEELVRVRKQVQVLSHQLEEERKGERKTREQLAELAEELTTHEETIESLRSEIAKKDSELLAGKQQINKLSAFISRRVGEGLCGCLLVNMWRGVNEEGSEIDGGEGVVDRRGCEEGFEWCVKERGKR